MLCSALWNGKKVPDAAVACNLSRACQSRRFHRIDFAHVSRHAARKLRKMRMLGGDQ
jgi:hypothetical protein